MALSIASLPVTLAPLSWLAICALTLTIGLYTRDPTRRIWCFPIFIWSAVKSVYAAKHDFGFLQPLAGLWADFVLIFGFHALSMLYIERRTLIAPVVDPSTTESLPTRSLRMGIYAYKSWFNGRHVPAQSTYPHSSDPQTSRAAFRRKLVFLILTFSKLVIYYTIHFHVLPAIFDEFIVEIQPGDVAPSQQGLLDRWAEVTAREVVVRTYVAFYWIWEGVFALDGMHAMLSILAVSACLDAPEEWPALYGSITQAVGLKRFWSYFWHTVVVKPYRSYGELLALRLLRLNPRGHAAKTVVAFAIFGISGLTHAAVAWIFEQPSWEWNLWWFLLNLVACTAETVTLAGIRWLAALLGVTNEVRAIADSWLGRQIGYIYVAAFFFWSVPRWKYPALFQEAVATERMKLLIMSLNRQPS